MTNNLYRKIKTLTERKYELKRLGGYIKHDEARRKEFESMVEEYQQIESTLDYITKNCVISPLMVEKIISKKEQTDYVLKIFRETKVVDGKTVRTGDFVACYLNRKNKYFDYDVNGLSYKNMFGIPTERYTNYDLPSEEFQELVKSLRRTDSYVLATRAEQSFVPTLPPSDYLEGVNFIKFFTCGTADEFVSFNFQHLIRFDLKQYLEDINADEFLSKRTGSEEVTK